MVDLRKLEEKFNNLFETETEESFNNWLHEKKMNESLALLYNETNWEKFQKWEACSSQIIVKEKRELSNYKKEPIIIIPQRAMAA